MLQEHRIPVQGQEFPGKEGDMPRPKPEIDHIPTADGGSKLYEAAGRLKDRKAIITGGDSGIGRSSAVLFAMEGADVLIAYLPDEEEDAQVTKKHVEKHGRACHLLPTDLTDRANCQKVIDVALDKLGRIDILFNNAAYQMMKDDITQLPEYVAASLPLHPRFHPSVRREISQAFANLLCAHGTETNGSTPSTPTSTRTITWPSTHCRT